MSLFFMWLGVMFPLVFSPGPANIVFAASGAQVGVKKSLPLVAGIDLIFIIQSLIVGYGFGTFIEAYPNTVNSLQLLGALYLIYLAFKFFKSHSSDKNEENIQMGFKDGLIIQILNGKGWVMVLLMFTLFTDDAQLAFANFGVAVLVVWLAILNISLHIVWVSIGKLLSKISNNPTYEKGLNIMYALSLVIVSFWLIFDNPLFKI